MPPEETARALPDQGARWTIKPETMSVVGSGAEITWGLAYGPVPDEAIDVVPAAERDRLRAEIEAARARYESLAIGRDAESDANDRLRAENEALKAEVRLLCALGDFAGHLETCNAPSGAPDCDCGFDDLYTQVRKAHRERSGQSDEQRPTHPPTCKACAGSGAHLCECDLGERPITNCFSCSGRKCAACDGSGHSRDSDLPKETR